MFEAYKRWRHSRGFGVHSPFAYHIVTAAITPSRRYAYYGYADIDTALETVPSKEYTYGQLRKDARLLLRLAVALGTRRIFIPADAHRALRAAAEASGAMVLNDRDCCSPSEGDLVLISSFDAKRFGHLKDAIAGHAAVMLTSPTSFPKNLQNEILSMQFDGVMLYGTRTALLLPRSQTAYTAYSMAF